MHVMRDLFSSRLDFLGRTIEDIRICIPRMVCDSSVDSNSWDFFGSTLSITKDENLC